MFQIQQGALLLLKPCLPSPEMDSSSTEDAQDSGGGTTELPHQGHHRPGRRPRPPDRFGEWVAH